MNEHTYRKRLCDLVNLEENSRDCVVLTLKPETQPMDLIRLGGFDGTENCFRMSKDPKITTITVFRSGGLVIPYSMNYGVSNTLVGEDRRKVRDQVMECVNLDFGIFTHGPIAVSRFNELVEATMGERTLNSKRAFTLKQTPSYASLFVNDQHIANIPSMHLETWLAEHNILLEVLDVEHKGSVDVEKGYMRRAVVLENLQDIDSPAAKPLSEQERYEKALDEAGKAFLAEGGWQGKDAAGVVQAFTEFAKKRGLEANPSLDDAVNKAKEKAAEHNANRKRNPRSPRPRWMGR